MNRADFLDADANSGKLKVTLIVSYWLGVFKYGHGPLGHGTLKSAVPQECIDELS